MSSTGYWYLATPHALYAGGKQEAYQEACRLSAILMAKQIIVYSPIVHNHPISYEPAISDLMGSFEWWVQSVDQAMMQGSCGLIVAMIDGWQESKGVTWEIEWYTSRDLLVVYWPVDQEIQLPEIRLPTMGAIRRQDTPEFINFLSSWCYSANEAWWQDVISGKPIDRNKGELLMLMVSELSEAMEGERKNLMDDKLPHRRMAEVELADCLIRIFDYAGGFGYDLGGAFVEKMAYNANRPDHRPEERIKDGGKKW